MEYAYIIILYGICLYYLWYENYYSCLASLKNVVGIFLNYSGKFEERLNRLPLGK